MEYNDKTIKKKHQLDHILEKAKKDFKTDRLKKHLKTVNPPASDYIETNATLNVISKKQQRGALKLEE
jgi:hypothetical protein